ncbi:MAG: hypothetical protein NNA23_06680 [Nitrospira sp.]|nr:hypothetical protein [Nitrospira sp.]
MSRIEKRNGTCPRCQGFMVPISLDGSDETTGLWLGSSGWRCVNCGERIDPLILENRRIFLSNC